MDGLPQLWLARQTCCPHRGSRRRAGLPGVRGDLLLRGGGVQDAGDESRAGGNW
jgi:hypothetical protein